MDNDEPALKNVGPHTRCCATLRGGPARHDRRSVGRREDAAAQAVGEGQELKDPIVEVDVEHDQRTDDMEPSRSPPPAVPGNVGART